MKAIVLSLLLLSLATAARAQEATIGFEDGALDATLPPANAWADLVGGQVKIVDEKTLELTIELAALPEIQPGMAYLFTFSDGTRDWFAGAITAPTLQYLVGTWKSEEEGPGETSDTTGTYATGVPGSITMKFPIALLGNATSIMGPGALTGDIKTGAVPFGPFPQVVGLDRAQGAGELALPTHERPSPGAGQEPVTTGSAPDSRAAATDAASAPASSSPSARVPAVGALATLGAVVGALLASRRRDA